MSSSRFRGLRNRPEAKDSSADLVIYPISEITRELRIHFDKSVVAEIDI